MSQRRRRGESSRRCRYLVEVCLDWVVTSRRVKRAGRSRLPTPVVCLQTRYFSGLIAFINVKRHDTRGIRPKHSPAHLGVHCIFRLNSRLLLQLHTLRLFGICQKWELDSSRNLIRWSSASRTYQCSLLEVRKEGNTRCYVVCCC